MKRYIVLPVRRDLVLGADHLELLALVDEDLLRMAVTLLDREREIEDLRRRVEILQAQVARLSCLK